MNNNMRDQLVQLDIAAIAPFSQDWLTEEPDNIRRRRYVENRFLGHGNALVEPRQLVRIR